jgi:hypothetical protein
MLLPMSALGGTADDICSCRVPNSDVGALSPVVLSASIAIGGGHGLTARPALLAIADEVIE